MLQLLGLTLIVATASCCDWSPWRPCDRACGGGNKTRHGDCGLFGWSSKTERTTCNEFCYNRGSFYGGHCHCTAWRSGSCCQTCRNIYIAHCKHGKQACGGSPDNIKCTECERYYVPAGYGNGCKRCQHNYVVDRGVPKCTCKDGYRLSSNGYSCYDVDECVVGNSHCNQICSNTVGSFKCSCRHGYTLDSDGQTCSDIDECLTGVAKCEQKCINLPGSYRCSCRPGFTLSTDGSCTDINECSRNNGGCMQTCVNEPGSFHCKCHDGYRLESHRLSCVDIDECSEGTSKCSQKCRNIHGSYTCSCNQGFRLNTDKYTCDDIDDCLGVICQNGGSCLDNIGSFTCSCKKGFTGRNCENDINECEGFLHGGCEDKCVNTIGSFRCECSGNTTLNNDGISCTGGEKRASVFARHGIARQLLPRGCSTILLTRCTDGNTVDVFMSSTSPWYQLQLNKSIIYTFGIVFVEVNKLALPVSIAGMEIYKSNDSFAIKMGSLALNEKDGLAYGNKRNSDCLNFAITPRDIRDFLMSSSFMKSVFQNIEDILPDWLKFSQFGTDILNVNDLHTELLPGNEIKTGTCRGAPVYGNRLYTVLKFGSSFSLSLYGNDVVLPKVITNEQFCLIIDICQDYGGSLFLIIPNESRNMLKKLNIIGQFTRKYGIEIQPAGIGVSLLNHINVKSTATSLQLWNGDQLFNYQVMPEANLWIDGELVWKPFDKLFFIELKTRSSIFVSVPKITSILRSIFLEEWNVYFNMDLLGSIGIKFKLFGQMHRIQLNVVKSSIQAYASLGGLITRKWCGVNADPPGLFLSVIVDINPFQDIPILKSGLFDFKNKVYAYFATDPRPTMNNISTITFIQNIVDLHGAAEIFVNTTIKNVFRYASLPRNTSKEVLSHLKNTAEEFVQTLENCLQELRGNNEHVFTNLIEHISDVWANGWSTLKKDSETFCDSIKDNAFIAKYNFTNLIDRELIHLKDDIHNIIDTMSSQVMQLYNNPIGFGIRYKGTLNIFFLKFAGLEIEFVYSVDQLGECSRFRKVYELLKGERAARIYGVASTGLIKVAPFIRMDVGAGLGLAISIDTPNKMIAQFHSVVNVLGIQAQRDTFLTQEGHYFFLTGKIWNTFLAELKISFESSEKKGIDTIDILGRFKANGGDDNSFQDSYLDGLRKIIQKISDAANERISSVQNLFSNAQKAFSKAQDWLEDKKITIRNANSAFDAAIKSLEYAKDKLEDAKIPFKNAISKLNDAKKN
ncbi:uncharacterized protein LOC132727521 [Ruditapes philippinarum]|uniref:uncharacterized protein LOC132727521 n=1 Tax=Ruditapes philippinarum TaxID=129788 RepID=UPI00295BF903|nr:uncharacterized protein LOC132727521 [Ruditapes philippinarum]